MVSLNQQILHMQWQSCQLLKLVEACQNNLDIKFLNLMPTNLYGPNDYFSDLDSHVIPALIHRMQKTIENDEDKFTVWGSGSPLREFLYVDDLSNFINFIIDKEIENDLINVGSGQEISIKNLALLIKDLMGFQGDVVFDSSKPDGNPRKLLDSSLMNELGWNDFTDLRNGLTSTIKWYKSNPSQIELINYRVFPSWLYKAIV